MISLLIISVVVTSELMFELYSVPSLAYCVDSVMSFYHNNHSTVPDTFTSDGLVISFNTSSTSIVPVLNGKGIMSHAKRFVHCETYPTIFIHLVVPVKDSMGCCANVRISSQAHPVEISWFPDTCYFTPINCDAS